jgi:chemosensory pili system protein ChpA (sensor histidine kinase/response regulator)
LKSRRTSTNNRYFLQQDEPSDQSYNQLIRALHTLRGSSSMAHIQQVFEASSKVETLFKTLMQDELESTSNETALLTHYAEFVRDYLHTLHQKGTQQQLDKIDQKFNQAWENYGFNIEEIAHGTTSTRCCHFTIAIRY